VTASVEDVARLRRMVAEPTEENYSDEDLATCIERYPLIDPSGYDPDEDDWTPTYDLCAAAAEVWEEKASAVAGAFDFQADGASYSRSQIVAQYQRQAARYRARRAPRTIRLVKRPRETGDSYIGNLPEES